MRLFGKPGGTRSQARAALLTIPFDKTLGISSVTPEVWVHFARRDRTLTLAARPAVLRFGKRPAVLQLTER